MEELRLKITTENALGIFTGILDGKDVPFVSEDFALVQEQVFSTPSLENTLDTPSI